MCPLYKAPGDVFRRDPALMVSWLVVPFTVFLSSFAMIIRGKGTKPEQYSSFEKSILATIGELG